MIDRLIGLRRMMESHWEKPKSQAYGPGFSERPNVHVPGRTATSHHAVLAFCMSRPVDSGPVHDTAGEPARPPRRAKAK
jgi:hypothetical protein